MPWRLTETTAKVQFVTGHWMPYRVYEACVKTGVVSNSRYYQLAVCEKLARDLGLNLDELIAQLPPPRSKAKHLFSPGPGTPIEEVREVK